MIKQYLFTPGPTPVPSEVAAAMAQPIIHHRTAPFNKAFNEVRSGLKALFGTKNDVLILASSGTGAMEAAVSNLLSPGEKALVVNGEKDEQALSSTVQKFPEGVPEKAQIPVRLIQCPADWEEVNGSLSMMV